MPGYRQLSIEDRCEIARLRSAGHSIRQIAAALDRQPSTISRELNRNSGSKLGYQPTYAQQQAAARRWTGSRLDRDAGLRDAVLHRLAKGWSPEQVAGRLAHETGQRVISHESIYRFVYAQLRRSNDGSWRLYLPRAKARRGWRGKRGGSPASFFQHRRPLTERPADAANRQTPGHWEVDFMLFATTGHSILVAHERQSRFTLIVRPPNRQADPTAHALANMLAPLPPEHRRTVSFDNGTEFARHYRLTESLGIQTFFCDTHSPWQKGGVENAIGRLRRALPRKTNLELISNHDIDSIASRYNNTPRKCLGFKTPAEAFQPLHFKCESTPRPSPG
jgi:transposase, IS30 family